MRFTGARVSNQQHIFFLIDVLATHEFRHQHFVDRRLLFEIERIQSLVVWKVSLICVRNGSRGLIGKCAMIDTAATGLTFGAFMSVYRTNHWRFIVHAFQAGDIQRQIRDNIGATINQITNKDMKAFRLRLPPENEQTAIAEVLSDMDTELAGLEQRREKTRAFKQAMMQELLTGRTRLL